MTKSGVYEILNTTNGKRYIGSATNLRQRKRQHWSELRRNCHRNKHLQNTWNKHGEEVFRFEVIEYWEPEFLVSMEQWWMNMLCPEYNLAPVARSSFGVMRTDETKAKMSKARKGVNLSDKHKANISAAKIGRKRTPFTPEHKAKISAAMKGNRNARRKAKGE